MINYFGVFLLLKTLCKHNKKKNTFSVQIVYYIFHYKWLSFLHFSKIIYAKNLNTINRIFIFN